MKPDRYPLPWCDALDAPYWKINAQLCLHRTGWRALQSGKPMSEIIPLIDALIASEPSSVAA